MKFKLVHYLRKIACVRITICSKKLYKHKLVLTLLIKSSFDNDFRKHF